MVSEKHMDGTYEADMATAKPDLEKSLSITQKSVGEGEIVELDQSEVFLRENGYDWGQVEAILEDKQKMKSLYRKVDKLLLPLLCGTYVLQYIDKSTTSYGAVFDLLTETNMDGDQYSWTASIFYFGYLFWEYPASYLAQHYRTGKVVAGTIIGWASVLMLTAACESFGTIAVCRFFLGCFEAPITPCFMLIVSMWYTRDQQPFRTGCFYCCNGVGSCLGGIFCYGIGQIDSFPVYKAIFLICGGMTFLWGLVVMWFLPDSPMTAKGFTLEEKAALLGVGRRNQTGSLNRTIKPNQIKETFMDLQVWILFLFTLLNELINGGVANFGKLIIKGLVSDPLSTTALGIPQGGFQVLFVLSGGFFASYFKNSRTTIMAVYLLPTIAGSCMLWKVPRDNKIGSLFGYYIVGAYVASLTIALQMPATNIGGYTKRVTATAFVFLAYCIGNIVGPHAFLDSEAPIYETGIKLILCCACIQFALAVFLRFWLTKRNKERDAKAAAAGTNGTADNEPLWDKTDFENPAFRYSL
ncbi:putative MFS transporter [Phyllosticta citricarpa]|uniref:MFS transporter n=1 Tax=Phyllosticta paracitricarpa TaxID=2016321 RepID=A0ABR1NF77_9PEZI